ncbi:SH2 domain-containing protein 3C-like isoform X1 [Dendronephthya gigantea]|uniref:SH2 domain-containing protein 3C-like isoform X1 n=1 Tax=Dendronephthya gigantea TaxID=151771 RepID=UPI00106D7FD5|nr:SH2 domain-containing protein 3C-like isoform X1 [Dendronephthya gigantea]XP_028411038.1 SH2 domain-containing protein 3C-like isoform X1 [Dendronephthya gigantea]
MSAQSLDQSPAEKRNYVKTTDRGIPFKKMAKMLSKRLMKTKEQDLQLDLVDQAWFHGRMTSEYAVKVLETEGEFLVRENPARPGDYFISVNENGVVKHFPIQRSTTKNLKYKYKLNKSGSFETLVDLVESFYSNKKLVTDSEEIQLLAPANRDAGMLLVPELSPNIQVASAPVSPAGTPPMTLRRERNCSDPNISADRLRSHFEGYGQRPRAESRSSPPSLYVEDFDVNQNEVIYETVNLPPKTQQSEQSALMKKKHSILNEVFEMFRNTLYKEFRKNDCLTLAKHMTRRDLEVVWGEGFCQKSEKELAVPNGLELILFPQGSELRQSILKRYSTVITWVSSMVIAAGGKEERVDILTMFIGIAHALFSSLGNLNGFMAVMEGLESAQVRRLKLTWKKLEESHPKLSIVYHNTLKSVYAILNSQGTHPSPGKVKPSLPYVAHVVKCLEVGPTPVEQTLNGVTELDELEVMCNHLSSARDYGCNVHSYRRQAVGFVRNMWDDTELERYFMDTVNVSRAVGLGFSEADSPVKMDGLLTLMSEHIEPNSS